MAQGAAQGGTQRKQVRRIVADLVAELNKQAAGYEKFAGDVGGALRRPYLDLAADLRARARRLATDPTAAVDLVKAAQIRKSAHETGDPVLAKTLLAGAEQIERGEYR